MKRYVRLFILAMSIISLAGCSQILTRNNYTGETGSLVLSVGSIEKNGSSNSSRALYLPTISKAVVTVSSSDLDESDFTTSVDISSGANSGTVTIDDIPVGKNRVITVQAYQDESMLNGITMRAVTEIVKGDNDITVDWTTTALGNVYNALLSKGSSIADLTDSQDTAIAAAVDTTKTNALLVDASSVAADFLSGSLKSKSSYLLTPGTVSFTYYYPIDSFSAYLSEPGSSVLTECVPGEKATIENCSPGTWTLYLVDEDNSKIIGTASSVKITSGAETSLGVISYDGIMIVVDASTFADYSNLYAWTVLDNTYTVQTAIYPGDTMTQYGSYYIRAFEADSTLGVIANKGNGSSDKLYGDDITFTEKGVYLLTNVSPGYTQLDSTGSSSGGSENIEDITFSNQIYINLATPSWSTTQSGTYSTITTTKGKIDTTQSVTIKFTEDDSDNSTGLIKLDLSSTTAATAVHIFGSAASSVGGLKITSNPDYAVNLELNGVTMTSTNYPCVEVTKGADTYVTLTGTNTLNDGRSYGTGYGKEYNTSSSAKYEDDDGVEQYCTPVKAYVYEGSDSKGTLYSKGNLILSGTGSLTVTESYKNCIASKGFITVNSGTLNLTSNAKNGFDALYGFTQNDGSITFTGNGGINASTESESTSYYVKKANGIAVDGIISSISNGWIKINGGTYTCTATYGKGMNAKWDSSEDEDTDGTTGTPDPSVYITGGTISINVSGTGWTNDNTVQNNNPIYYYYYDADGVSCHENIKAAAEGIEGNSTINISGGTIEITAADDALNESLVGGSVTISGGSLYCAASGGDAVDSNGNIFVKAGTIVACAPTGSEDGLDAGDGYSITISGGLVASCSGSSNASADASNAVVINAKSLSLSSGSTMTVYDSSSNLLYAFTMPSVSSSGSSNGGSGSSSSGYSSIIIASPNFTSTGTYTIYKGSTVSGGTNFNGLYTTLPTVSSTGSSAATISVSSTSGCYSNSSSGGGGSSGPGGGGGGSSGGGGR